MTENQIQATEIRLNLQGVHTPISVLVENKPQTHEFHKIMKPFLVPLNETRHRIGRYVDQPSLHLLIGQ